AGAAVLPRPGLVVSTFPAFGAKSEATDPLPFIAAFISALPEPGLVLSKDGTVLFFNAKSLEYFDSLKLQSHISAAIRNPKVLDAVETCGPQIYRQMVFFTDRVPVERHMSAAVNYLDFNGEAKEPAIFITFRDLTEQLRYDQ